MERKAIEMNFDQQFLDDFVDFSLKVAWLFQQKMSKVLKHHKASKVQDSYHEQTQ